MYRDMTGTAFSLVISMALVGNVLGNYLMGWVAQELGLHLLPVALIVLVAVMGGLLLGLGKRIEQYTN
jgi:predicted MFS family arabinose efflux permease